jgi:hypothetical protein
MKKILLSVLISSFFFVCYPQQTMSFKRDADKNAAVPVAAGATYRPFLKLYGIGNLNAEALSSVNSSGKLQVSVAFMQTDSKDLTAYLSFNKNATNKDTLLPSTVLFPEIGNHSFLGTLEYKKRIGSETSIVDPETSQTVYKSHWLGLFGEFSHKKLKLNRTRQK